MKQAFKLSGSGLLLAAALFAGQSGSLRAQTESTPASQSVSYVLGSGDKLKINVFGSTDLSGEFSVTDSGTISYPLLGSIDVRAMTAVDLQALLQGKLGQGYINDPRVTVEVIKYRPFYVYGEVMRAGEYPFGTRMTLRQAIATAGGLSYRASTRKIFIQRSGAPREVRYDLKRDLLAPVFPGDTIRVGERHF
jgi:polysaccharide export outer membrane protein